MRSASTLAPRWQLRARAARSTSPCSGRRSYPSQPRYPRRNPGLAWVTPATLERVEPDRTRWRWTQALRLANPSAAAAFTEQAAAGIPGDLSFETWQVQRDFALGDAQPVQVIVTMFTILLLIVAFVVVGILVGARASDQHREIGLLKAAGFTPRQVGAVFALESTALGLVAAALGFALGSILAPRLAAPSAETLLGSPTIAANPWHVLVASLVVLPVLLAGALTSTRRSTRFSVLEAIRAGGSSPPNFTACARVRPIRPAVDDRGSASGPARPRTQGASPRSRDRPHRCAWWSWRCRSTQRSTRRQQRRDQRHPG